MQVDAKLIIAELLEQNNKLVYEKAVLTAQLKMLMKEKEESKDGDIK